MLARGEWLHVINEHTCVCACQWIGLTRWTVLNYNFHKIYWMLRWLSIYYRVWMSIVCDLMGHCSAQWRVKINSVGLSRTRFVTWGNFRQYIFWLQDSSYRSLELSNYQYIIYWRLSSIYHQSYIYQFIFILHCHVFIGIWSTVAVHWHCTSLVLRWGIITLLLQSVTPADTLHCALLLAWGCLWWLCHHR